MYKIAADLDIQRQTFRGRGVPRQLPKVDMDKVLGLRAYRRSIHIHCNS